ncbi:MAG: hypothetical protein MZW92_40885 [Comamonadaceae bacterium]|nr:hypothetical protein [Comamonadaceae bacterium]
MFCPLPIPIVTLCALILQIIMVSLFDLFFRWLPFLFLCLADPGSQGSAHERRRAPVRPGPRLPAAPRCRRQPARPGRRGRKTSASRSALFSPPNRASG